MFQMSCADVIFYMELCTCITIYTAVTYIFWVNVYRDILSTSTIYMYPQRQLSYVYIGSLYIYLHIVSRSQPNIVQIQNIHIYPESEQSG